MSMDRLESVLIGCPVCGETIEIQVDTSVPRQTYVEDCSVCCRPLVVTARVGADGAPWVDARFEDD